MNKNIEDPIKEITLSIIQFDSDIKTCNPEGITNFLSIIDTYKDYFSLRFPDKHEEKILFSNFKKEIQDVFTDLFVNHKIFEVAESLFIKNGVIKMERGIPVKYHNPLTQEIEQKIREATMELSFQVCKYDGSTREDIKNIRWVKNPLYNLSDEEFTDILVKQEAGIRIFKEFGSNPFKEFVSKYQGLYDNEKTGSKPIIDIEYISYIYKKYHAYFTEDEDIDTWINRFIYPNGNQIDPIDIDKKASKGSNKIVLLAILAAIRPRKEGKFDYNDFVLDRFGIKNYFKTNGDHKDEPEYQKIFKECETYLKE